MRLIVDLFVLVSSNALFALIWTPDSWPSVLKEEGETRRSKRDRDWVSGNKKTSGHRVKIHDGRFTVSLDFKLRNRYLSSVILDNDKIPDADQFVKGFLGLG